MRSDSLDKILNFIRSVAFLLLGGRAVHAVGVASGKQ